MSTALPGRIAWRRRNVPHHYVGTLTSSEKGIRLAGRDPATGIEVALSIPFEEVERVRTSADPQDRLIGEGAVVVDLAGSQSVLLREIGGALRPAELAERLEGLRAPTRRERRRLVARSADTTTREKRRR